MSKIDKFEGDMFWDAADTEDSVSSPEDHMENEVLKILSHYGREDSTFSPREPRTNGEGLEEQ